nr:AMP-binding protein [Lachnospiraceae bacterium]
YNCYGFITDRYGNLMPEGMPGELCLCGPQIAEGYWKLPEKTAEVFVECPYIEGQKMYRTGDLARYNEEGEMEYLGRIDFQVKLRGFRIELGEIENRAAGYDGIKLVCAQVKKEMLVLYYTTAHEGAADDAGLERYEEGLKSFLSETLADFMMPSVYMKLDNMPMTPNGKIDRKKLPEPSLAEREIIEPETETEKALFDIVSEVLDFKDFGVTGNLVSLGLSSIGAMKVTALIKEKLNKSVKTFDILKEPDIRSIAKLIENEDGVVIIHDSEKKCYPITENQRGLYIAWEMNPGTVQYNIPEYYTYTGKDAHKLAEAVRKAINIHGVLKTGFVKRNGDVIQTENYDADPVVTVEILDFPPDTGFFQSRVKPFDLLKDRLYRAEIYVYKEKTYLFLDVHHIVFDGLSSTVMLESIEAFYDGRNAVEEEITAYDFALYEKKLAGSEEYIKAEGYFSELLSDCSVAVYPDSDDPDGVDYKMIEEAIDMSKIDRFCEINKVTPFSFLNAAFAETLSRITREEKPMYLTVSNGREVDPRLSSSVGMFVKTLPVVYTALKEQDIAKYADEMRRQLNNTISNNFYPYTSMVEKFGVKGEIMFDFHGGMDWSGEKVGQLSLDTAQFPISVTIEDRNGRYFIETEYDGNRYSHTDMIRFTHAFKNVALTMTSAEKLSEVSLVSEEEKKELIELSAGEKYDYDRNEIWLDLLKKNVTLYGDKNAVTDSRGSYTYKELYEGSDRLSVYFTKKGIKEWDFVILRMGRYKEYLMAITALHKIGASYVPVDADYPADRIAYIRENSEAKYIFSEDDVRAGLEEIKEVPEKLKIKATPRHIAYMIYTSGSTGNPKGTMISQGALMNFAYFISDKFGHHAGVRISCHVNFAFDASVEDLYPVLISGGEIFIVPEEERKDLDLLRKFLKKNRIEGGNYSTQIGQLLGAEEELDLKYINLGGEKMVTKPKVTGKIYNTYGPTEFTDDATYFEVDKDREYDNIPIGRPLYNCYGFITDKYGNLMPEGMSGELCLCGPQIGEGYWKLPEKTAEVFVDCPYIEGQKMYRTGDLARYNEDGEMEYLGRIDFQVKLRGFRIELGEIESRAAGYDGIKLVCAQVKKEMLVLYYTTDNEGAADDTGLERYEAGLKNYLSETLADFMMPSVYMKLDSMPMTPNGKIDRKMLPEPLFKQKLLNEPPVNTIERDALKIARDALPGIEFGVTDDLFSLGINSLKAMIIISRINDLGLMKKYRVSDLMRYKNIRDLVSGNKRVFYNYDAYDPEKPMLIFVYGISFGIAMNTLLDIINEKFNIFVIEDIFDHYKILFKDSELNYNDLLDTYLLILEENLPKECKHIDVFWGFSWSGQVAYDLAARWHQKKNERPLAYVIDSYIIDVYDKSYVEGGKSFEEILQSVAERFKLEINETFVEYILEKFSLVEEFNKTCTGLPKYDGKTVFVSASADVVESDRLKNISLFSSLASDFTLVTIDKYDHYDMFLNTEAFPFLLKTLSDHLD